MKWKLKEEPEGVAFEIDSMLYKRSLDELAEVLYKIFCQLDLTTKSTPNPTAPYSESGNLNKLEISHGHK